VTAHVRLSFSHFRNSE